MAWLADGHQTIANPFEGRHHHFGHLQKKTEVTQIVGDRK
jgi:hypothetical protein